MIIVCDWSETDQMKSLGSEGKYSINNCYNGEEDQHNITLVYSFIPGLLPVY